MARVYTIKTNMERFVPKMGDRDENGCQPFLGFVAPNGYGSFAWRQGDRLRNIGAHRASFQLHKGEIPDDLLVRHTCDNRSCVNPEHLVLGTQQDNMADCMRRRRTATGAQQGGSKLTWSKAREIRSRHAAGESQVALAAEFGVKQPNISRIIRGETWRE